MKKLRQIKGIELRSILLKHGFELEISSEYHDRFKYSGPSGLIRITIPQFEFYVPEQILETVIGQLRSHVDEDTILNYFYNESDMPETLESNRLMIDHVRRRPGMYIRSQGSKALHAMLDWGLASVIDQAMTGNCTAVTITILPDNTLIIEDNGKLTPQLLEAEDQDPEWLAGKLDNLMEGPKAIHWGGMNYQIIIALSQSASLEVKSQEKEWVQEYFEGIAHHPTQVLSKSSVGKIGTRLTLQPDLTTLGNESNFNDADLVTRLQELAYMIPELQITVIDKRKQPPLHRNLKSSEGVAEFLRFINRDREVLHDVIAGRVTSDYKVHRHSTAYPVTIDFACQFTTDDTEFILSYVNYEQTLYNGIHVENMYSGVISPFISQANEQGLLNRFTSEITSADFFPGFTGIIHIRTPYPTYCGQFKDKLTGDGVGLETYLAVFNVVEEFIDDNPELLQTIINRTLQRKKQRDSRRFGDWEASLLPPIAKLR